MDRLWRSGARCPGYWLLCNNPPRLSGLKQHSFLLHLCIYLLLTGLESGKHSVGTALQVGVAHRLGLESSVLSQRGQWMLAVRGTSAGGVSWDDSTGPVHVAASLPHSGWVPRANIPRDRKQKLPISQGLGPKPGTASCPLYSSPTFKDGDIILPPAERSVQEFWTEEALEGGQAWGKIMNLDLMEKRGERTLPKCLAWS